MSVQTTAPQTTAPDPVQHVFQLATGYVISTALQLAVRAGARQDALVLPRQAHHQHLVAEYFAHPTIERDAVHRVLARRRGRGRRGALALLRIPIVVAQMRLPVLTS